MICFAHQQPPGTTAINFFSGLSLQEAISSAVLIPRKPDNLLLPYFVSNNALPYLEGLEWVDDYCMKTRSITLLRRLLTVRSQWSRR